MATFAEGATVALKADSPTLGLSAGDTGTVWALYGTEPPAYEVTFSAADGREFDALVSESELTESPAEHRAEPTHEKRSQVTV